MKVDIFSHVIPPRFAEAVTKLTPAAYPGKLLKDTPTLNDWEYRFRIMDKFGEYGQVITTSSTHAVMFSDKAVELARIANDEVAELIYKYPERFLAGVATLPMNDMDACLAEADRAISELKFRGVLVWASAERKPLDSPEYVPLYEKMSKYNLPIWIHPYRGPTTPDYISEKESKYHIYSIFGWVYDSTVAICRLAFSGIFDKYPNLKFITHHCGAMVPYFADRIALHCGINEMRYKDKDIQELTRHPMEYFHMFYNDTALSGGAPGLKCAYDFFGAEHILFGTDSPLDCQNGNLSIAKTIHAIEQMDIPDSDKKKIFEDNARKLLRLPV